MSSSRPWPDPWAAPAAARRRWSPRLDPARLVVAVLAVAPALPIRGNGPNGELGARTILVVAVAGVLVAGRRALDPTALARVAAVVLAGELVAGARIGRTPLLVTGLLLVAGLGALLGWDLRGRDRTPRPVGWTAPFAAPLVAAAAIAWSRTTAVAPTAVLAALAIAVSTRPTPGAASTSARVTSAVGGALGRAGRALVAAVVFVVALPVLYLPGAASRAVRRLVPARRRPVDGAWVTARGPEVDRRDAARPFAVPPAPVVRRRRLAVEVAATGLIVVAILAAGSGGTGGSAPPGTGSTPTVQGPIADRFDDEPYSARPATADQPQADALQRELRDVVLLPDPVTGYRTGDRRGALVNVQGGQRRTLASPCRDCPRVKVALLGGSLLFGIGQRDRRTIASELVRLAAADGLAVDAANLGVPGWTFDQEQLDLERRRRDQGYAPDVVVVLDGFNDGAATLADVVLGGSTSRPARLDADRSQELIDRVRAIDAATAARVGRLAAERYDREARPFVAGLRRDGIAVRRFFQPDASAAAVQRDAVTSLGVLPPAFYDRYRLDQVLGTMASRLGSDVVDLRDAFDRTPEPVFIDTAHVSEAGATRIAQLVYRSLRPTLVARAR